MLIPTHTERPRNQELTSVEYAIIYTLVDLMRVLYRPFGPLEDWWSFYWNENFMLLLALPIMTTITATLAVRNFIHDQVFFSFFFFFRVVMCFLLPVIPPK